MLFDLDDDIWMFLCKYQNGIAYNAVYFIGGIDNADRQSRAIPFASFLRSDDAVADRTQKQPPVLRELFCSCGRDQTVRTSFEELKSQFLLQTHDRLADRGGCIIVIISHLPQIAHFHGFQKNADLLRGDLPPVFSAHSKYLF